MCLPACIGIAEADAQFVELVATLCTMEARLLY